MGLPYWGGLSIELNLIGQSLVEIIGDLLLVHEDVVLYKRGGG